MARVEITFCRTFGADFAVQVPVIIGGSERTQVITTASTTDDISRAAAAGENIVEINSDADIYCVIADDPEASAPDPGEEAAGFRVKADIPTQRYIAAGQKVAVIVG
jgi:hypothetical protein